MSDILERRNQTGATQASRPPADLLPNHKATDVLVPFHF